MSKFEWAVLGGIVVAFFVFIGGIVTLFGTLECVGNWADSGRQYRYKAITATCQVHDGKGWVPSSRVRVE